MAPVKPRRFPLEPLARAFRTARSPAGWRRGMALHLAPVHHLHRIAAWVGRWRGPRPRLRQTPLWGEGLARAVDAPPAAEAAQARPVRPRRSFPPFPAGDADPAPERAADRPKRTVQTAPAGAGESEGEGKGSESASETALRAAALSPEAGPALLSRLASGESGPDPVLSPGEPHPTGSADPAARRPVTAGRWIGQAAQAREPRPEGTDRAGTARAGKERIADWRRQVGDRIRRHLLRPGDGTVFRDRQAVGQIPGNGPHATGSAGDGGRGESVTPAAPEAADSPWRRPLTGRRAAPDTLMAAAGGAAAGSVGSPASDSPTRRTPGHGTAAHRTAPEAPSGAAASGPSTSRYPSAPTAGNEPARSIQGRPLDALLHRALSREAHEFPATGASDPETPADPPDPEDTPTGRSADREKGAADPHRDDRHPPLPPPGPASGDEDPDHLADRIGRILMEEARRHGIDL